MNKQTANYDVLTSDDHHGIIPWDKPEPCLVNMVERNLNKERAKIGRSEPLTQIDSK